jgi:hypothetical protein
MARPLAAAAVPVSADTEGAVTTDSDATRARAARPPVTRRAACRRVGVDCEERFTITGLIGPPSTVL